MRYTALKHLFSAKQAQNIIAKYHSGKKLVLAEYSMQDSE